MPETSLMFIVSEMQGKRTDDLFNFFSTKLINSLWNWREELLSG